MKLLFENWRKYLKEAHGLKTTWDDVHIDAVFEITGRSCDKASRECKPYTTDALYNKLKNKPIVDTLDPKRVKYADPKHPLIVVVNRDTEEYQYIMDGNHRFANAIQSGVEIQVKELYTDEYNQLFGDAE